MAKIYKCDKCKKVIKEYKFDISFHNENISIFDGRYQNHDLCQECAKPLAEYLKKFF